MMSIDKANNHIQSKKCQFFTGAKEIIPLCLSVIPWAMLVGSMGIHAGLGALKSAGMSAIMFAGAAQIVTISLQIAGGSALTIIISVFFITAQHFLYGLTLREYVAILQAKYRISIGFLLTDELFALSCTQKNKEKLTSHYLLGAGLFFYACWNIFTWFGIFLAESIPNLQRFHLDFSIIATFVTIVVPMIRSISMACGVIISLVGSILLSYFHIEGAIIIAGLTGMFISVILERIIKGA